ncbi:hypothetical protein CYY_002045 [Polysphondylium violaceum]|uniref:Carbohydrate binding domain-containing protein n=1 Tax=Polysphondylium violaceum TaxID=133409 RepID=A0A8J4PZZ1_9MYCE|nr:hypothetical protein CYY_002045 [Polysphondylium violaceum]
MNKFLTLFVLLAIVATTTTINALDTYGVGIYNVNNAIAIGIIDYSAPPNPSTQLTITGLYYPNSPFQISSYNYVTKYLTFVALEPGTNNPFLVTVDCNAWRVAYELPLTSGISYAGFQYDQTPMGQLNMFTTTWNGNGMLYVSKMNPLNNQLSTTDSFPGTLLSTAYQTTTYNYMVTFSNSSGIYTKLYTYYGQLQAEQQFGFSNTNLQVYSGPTNMFYNPQLNAIMATVQLRNVDGSIFSALAYMDWSYGTFKLSNMASYPGFVITTSVPDLLNKNLVYSFGYVQNIFYIYTFSPATNTGVSVVQYNSPVLSAF